jgi:hypothetical protein
MLRALKLVFFMIESMRTFLHKPTSPDAEPDNAAERESQDYDWHCDGDGESRGRDSAA